ncbi:unnamed protein product [Prorocentrum cordatum]|uniref:Peroxiredoxin-like 2 activated in M-CSF stimulated monocytes n=1 Tax=Prorocentrum cordatum TaxID=2364126 RepID=A0ABN9QMX4_9DINO|nr:unnamed protein product [Polarella glacialis]|mmetsp:Transcript_54016/g.154087  ORF Transcript_54016/g.154087 Transcript_54016/m.154087 type:complete len:158 (-) Transcript_54016:65-538(-)
MENVLPRVEALDRAEARRVPFIAVVREVAPTAKVPEDGGEKGLGVGEFQARYFQGRPVYWDEGQGFVKAMGSRKIKLKFKSPWWNPIGLFREVTEGLKKLKEKGVEGNLVGDGMIQGGVLCIGPKGQGVTYAHFEENDPDVGMPADSIVDGVAKFEF